MRHDVPEIGDLKRARHSRRLPTVFTPEEVSAMPAHVQDMPHLMARLLSGAGLRLMEC
ncbi:MAG: hypothetical protein V3R80_14470 [Candidatus Tectomicrobia bacterium]